MDNDAPSGDDGLLPLIQPGEILLEEFVRPRGLSLARVARDLGVNQGRVAEIVRGRRRISAEMALRLARYFGTSPDLWLGLQMEHDIRLARRSVGAAVEAEVRSLEVA